MKEKEKEKEKESDHLRETPKTNLIIIHQWRSALEFVPSPPPPLQTLITDDPSAGASNVPSAFPPPSPSTSFAYSPSLLIIASIIAFVIAASASIHLLLRLLSRQRSLSPPPLLSRQHPFHSSESSSSSSAPSPPTDRDRDSKTLIDSLPLFTLASSLAAMPKSSPDCAVCLSPFAPDDELRLLPACRHAFHANCIDAWLPSTPSCPLCRSPVTPPIPPPDLPTDPSRSSSFRLEIGSVSRRRYSVDSVETATPHARSYSIGSSFEYLVADEVDAVVSRVQTAKDAAASGDGPPPPGDEVAAEVGGTGRGWMREYVDRIASSASSSFSSLRLSSRRFDGGGGGGRGRRESWDMEVGDESAYYASFYRWLVGASS